MNTGCIACPPSHLVTHSYLYTKCNMQESVCVCVCVGLRVSLRIGRGLPVTWITLYMWGQYVQCWSVCVCVWLLLGDTPHNTPPPLPSSSIKQEGERHLCHFALRHRDNHTLTGHTNTLDKHIPEGHTDYPEKRGSSLCSACWIPPVEALKKRRQNLTTLSIIISPAQSR